MVPYLLNTTQNIYKKALLQKIKKYNSTAYTKMYPFKTFYVKSSSLYVVHNEEVMTMYIH